MTDLRHAFIAAALAFGACATARAGDLAHAATAMAGAAPAAVAGSGRPAPAAALKLHYANANARLGRNGTRLTTTGPDVVASAFASAPVRGRTYVEAAIFHGGQHAAGVSLWGESPDRLRDDAHPGRSYGAGGASAQAVSAWTMVAYANYGLTGDTKVELGTLPGTPGQRIVVQVAIDADSRAVWMKLSTADNWAGGGNPATGARPTLVLDGTGPIRVGGNVSSPASYLELLAPAAHAGPAPAGFTPFG